jgi:hypothetical protein
MERLMSVCAKLYRVLPATLKDLKNGEFTTLDQLRANGSTVLDLDKSWDIVHVFLTGDKEHNLKLALSNAVFGNGQPLGDPENGYCFLTSGEVKLVSEALAELTLDECADRMKALDLEGMDLYSCDPDLIEDTIDEAQILVEQMRDFYQQASSADNGVFISFG